ncbi:MAG: response regulator [Syntrophaceae bacterium]|nr:response regulator [Syntrophaceae bacterium]
MQNPTKRILIVDDDQGILDSFEVLLGDRYHLIKAENGFDAIRILETDPPHLMFLDIRMPGLDGIEILRRLQKEEKCVDVVIITALDQENAEEEARSLGVIDYLKKPLDIFEVERITSQVLSSGLQSAN